MGGSVPTELRTNGGDGDSGGHQEDVAGMRKAGAREVEGLAFHHFPIPDLSPAENTEILAGLVDQLESLVASGKVGGTNFGFGLIWCIIQNQNWLARSLSSVKGLLVDGLCGM